MKNLRKPKQFSIPQAPAGSVAQVASDFLVDAELRRLSPNTLNSYRNEIAAFLNWLGKKGTGSMAELPAGTFREYLMSLSARRNPGGQFAAYRVLRTLTFWWERETDGSYISPIRKVKPPKVSNQPLPGISRETFDLLLQACDGRNKLRDRAVLYFLGDTGIRANELCDLQIGDLDLAAGSAVIRAGKGNKRRLVYFGSKTRKELRHYLNLRSSKEDEDALFATDDQEPLTYWGLRQIVRRLAAKAGVPTPGVHDFRRFFALSMLRKGADLVSISRMMGHSGISVTQRYLALVDGDLRAVHNRASPLG
jgi:site-specific recombinase XerD